MRIDSLPGYWYCDHLGDTIIAAKWNAREVHDVAVVVPPEPLLWLAGASDGVRFAGTGQNTGKAWEWDGWAWQDRGPTVGLHAVIYDKDDNLVTVSRGDSPTGALGWRYVDDAGTLIRAVDTYDPLQALSKKFGITDLWEWVEHGNIFVGQGDRGLIAIVDGKRKRIDRLFDPTGIAEPYCYAVRFHKSGNDLAIAYYEALPYVARFVWLTVDELKALPDDVPNKPVEGIGPLTPPRTDDGKTYDLARFIIGDANTWPRRGPTHPMNRVVQGDLLFFVKFDQSTAYEMWGTDENWIYHLEDASNPTTYKFSDPRWFPRLMRIGQSHLFDSGPHQLVFYDRASKQEIRREPVRRRMWLHAIYDSFYWGPQLGTRATAIVVYDTTDGNRLPGRNVELGFYALGAGSARWESYPSEVVWANGEVAQFPAGKAQFTSDFYLVGGPNTQPQLTGCVEPVVPHLPPQASGVQAPRVNIVSYGRTLKVGEPWGAVVEDPNSKTVTTIEWLPKGNAWDFHVGIVNPAGGNRSGLERLVRLESPEPPPPPPPPETREQVCRRIWREELERGIDDDGLRDCVTQMARGRTEKEQRDIVRQSQEYADLQKRKREMVPLTADGKVFRRNGTIWQWRGVSAFKLLDLFARGEDIRPFLDSYPQANILRVWPYVPWPGTGWESPDEATVREFLKAVAPRYVELTLLTDDDPGRIPWAQDFVRRLTVNAPANLLFEIGNEPQTHKNINTPALRAVLDASPFLYSSGNYEDSNAWFGRYYTDHTPRDAEWPRKAKELLEFYEGWGPEKETQPHRVPCVADEPIKPNEAGFNLQDFYTYGALSAISGAGATFHCETAKYANVPTPDEARCADAFYAGLTVFPPDACLGAYDRIDEQGRTLRTYIVGNYMVRVRPTTTIAPESGWTPLDSFGIAWRRA